MFDLTFPSSWPHTWQGENDARSAVWTIQLGDDQVTYGLHLASLAFWLEIVCCVLLQSCFAALVGAAVYTTIVTRPRGSRLAFWTGFGVYIPMWFCLPYVFVDYANFQNTLFRFTICVVVPIVSAFRTSEAIYGFAPKQSTVSLQRYLLYYASPLLLRRDHKTGRYIKASRRCIYGYLLRFCGYLWLTGFAQSLFYADIPSFPSLSGPRPHDWYAWRSLVSPSQWKDNLLLAVLFQSYLTTFGEGLMFVTALVTRRQVQTLMDNPMFESSSPSDFWGKRWNLLIHECLKNGVYKPVRSNGGSAPVAVLAAFAASAIFHEWLLMECFAAHFDNQYGMTTLFFTWQAVLVTLDGLTGNSKLFRAFARLVPVGPLRTVLVIMCGLPVAHWFIDSYLHSGFFEHSKCTMVSFLPME